MQNASPDIWKEKLSSDLWLNAMVTIEYLAFLPKSHNISFIWSGLMSLTRHTMYKCLWSKWTDVSANKKENSTTGHSPRYKSPIEYSAIVFASLWKLYHWDSLNINLDGFVKKKIKPIYIDDMNWE